MKRLLFALLVFLPFQVDASGLQSSFTASNINGLTRSTTMIEYDSQIDTSSNLIDKSGRGHHLAPTNSPGTGDSTFQDNSGRRLKTRTFTIAAQTAYSVAHHADFNIFDSAHTVTVVFKVDSIPATDQLLLRHTSGASDGFTCYVTSTTGVPTVVWRGVGPISTTISTAAITVGYWNIIQIVREGNVASVYLNGTAYAPGDVTAKGVDASTPLYIGGVPPAVSTYLNGAILYTRVDAEALSLDRLNYERGQLFGIGLRSDIGYDFSRTTTATQPHSDGTFDYVAANVPRGGGDGGGVRIGGQSTNYALQSQTFGTTWSQVALTSITSNGAVAPDGTVTADGLVSTAVDTVHGVTQDVTLTAANWTTSVYAKPGNKNWLYIGDTYLTPTTATWLLKAPATKPSARQDMLMSFDSGRNVAVIFGGRIPAVVDETWEWNGTTWSQKYPASKPSARYAYGLAYDSSIRAETVLFGGWDTTYDGETWVWNGTNWTQKSPVTNPAARYSHNMIYDSARGVVVMFGGYKSTGITQETWEWNGANWTEVATGAVTKPAARYNFGMAYDASRGVTVLFGGVGAGGIGAPLRDTWEWDGANWVEKATGGVTKPSARYSHCITYDSSRSAILLYAGAIALTDAWEWNGTTWTLATNAGDTPTQNYGVGCAYDSSRNVNVYFGGQAGGARTDATFTEVTSGGSVTEYSYFNLSTGAVGTKSVGVTSRLEPYANGYYRASMMTLGTAASHTYKIYSSNADADNDFAGDAATVNTWLWGAQSELGSFSSSYIPTTTTSVTETQDSLTIRPYKIGKGMQLGGEKMWIDFSQDANAASIQTNAGGYTLTKSGTMARRNAYADAEYYHYFNGTDGFWYVNSSDFNPAGNFSVVAVVTPDSVTGSHVIMSKYTATDDQRGWLLYQTDDDISLSRTTDGTAGTLLAANVNNCLKVGKPVVITGSYSTTAGLWIKVDAFTTATNAGATGTVHPSTYNFLIGNHGTGAYFNGKMHFLSFHDHGVGGAVLTEAQHDSLYNRFKQPNILPPKIGNSYTAKQLTIEFEAKCPYTSTTDIGAKRVLVGITNYLSPVVTSTKNAIEVYHGSDGMAYGELYDSTGGTQRYIRSAAMTTLNQWHKYKFYIDFSSLANSTFTVDTTVATDKSNMSGTQDVNVLDSLIRLGQTYDVATTSYLTNSGCAFKNLRIQPNRF